MLASLQFLTPLTAAVVGVLAAGLFVGFGLLRWIGGPPAAVARRWGLIGIRSAAVITLLLILLNPSDVSQTPGPIDRPDIFYLLDSSQSMAVGDKETRFDHAARLMREADQVTRDEAHAQVKLFRFGHRLAAVESESGRNQKSERQKSEVRSESLLNSVALASDSLTSAARTSRKPKPLAPTDSDTQLLTALRQVSSRFGRRPPAGLVIFSDGRARDESGVEQLAAQFAKLNVPVHVVPVGDTAKGGDVAIVACVVPPRARRFAEVEVQVFLRSYGYDGRRCEVTLIASSGVEGEADRNLAPPVPVTLHDGFQSVGLSFRTDTKTRKLQFNVSSLPDEVSTANNSFKAEVQIDRTKIRVLYVEGSSQPLQPVQMGTRYEVRGPYSDLQKALTEDEDIECVVLAAPYGRGRLQRVAEAGGVTTARGFPETVAELSAFDAIILSDVAANTFTEQQLEWLDKWIGQRGGGLLMVGGQRSFSAGDWDDTPLAAMLPIEMRADNDWLPGTQVSVLAEPQAMSHPLWTIVSDERQNRDIIGQFPSFFGANRWSGVKPNLTRVLAMSNLAAADVPAGAAPPVAPKPVKPPSFFDSLQKNLIGKKPAARNPAGEPEGVSPRLSDEEKNRGLAPAGSSNTKLEANVSNQPAIVAGQYGRGRTMAMAMPITPPWANDFLTKWGGGDSKYSGKFWRNAIYWLTESSSIGRRRLVVTADKKFYRPGETISLTAAAFDEAANQTGSYKITSMIEPQTSLNDLESNYSPVRWPDGKPRESGETGSFIAWGEEFDLPRTDAAGGKPAFALELPIADALTVGSASQSLRVELTAMEEFTQVDSTSLDIQILHDPFEQQNPFPNHELLASIAKHSGGQVINDSTQLAEVLRDVPMKVGTPIVKKTPLWSTWLLWTWMLGLLSVEWIWRRVVGLA
ncbi:MAG: putative membrane protein [Planctomycetota bacterium]|nr:MAG: putative membrane protein [Planctomycetota bacterium]